MPVDVRLHSFKAGIFRSHTIFNGAREEKRRNELVLPSSDPEIGVLLELHSQCGLQIVAHLKYSPPW